MIRAEKNVRESGKDHKTKEREESKNNIKRQIEKQRQNSKQWVFRKLCHSLEGRGLRYVTSLQYFIQTVWYRGDEKGG